MRTLTNTDWMFAVFGVYLVVLFMLVVAGAVFGPIPIAW
jgi:hypothetical protein